MNLKIRNNTLAPKNKYPKTIHGLYKVSVEWKKIIGSVVIEIFSYELIKVTTLYNN